MTTHMNYSVNVSLYTKINVNLNKIGKDRKPLEPKVEKVFSNRVSVIVKADAPLTAAQLKAKIKAESLEILPNCEEVIKFKGAEMKDSDLITDVMVEYLVTADRSGVETTTTTTVAPTTTTTTEAPTTTTTTEEPTTTTVAP